MRDAGYSRERVERDTDQAAEPGFLLMLLRMPEAPQRRVRRWRSMRRCPRADAG